MGELLAALSPDGIEERQRRQLCDAYAEFCVDYYPIMFLEGLSSNLRAAEACWKAAQTTFLIGANLACDEGFFYVTAAKRAGNQVIGAQHSGHYGYIEDMSVVAEFEFPLCDKMITFGWTKFERELPNTEPIPLPSPRLSEKPINGRILNDSKGTRAWKRDVLFMSNLILRFPHISTCGQARIDFIDEIHSSQKNLIAAICAADILIDHKPYNQNNVDFAENHYRDLVNIGRGRYRLLESVQKGLSPALLKGYRVVLWDQIGSGTLDCFVCKVPTMVYWERLYSRETAAAQRVVRQLEDVGVVHSSPETLVVEIRKFLADPAEWMAAEKRVKAIEAFCYQFARTDPDWSAQWRKALKALAELSAKPKQTVIRS
jgi:putative transferase (TIGR04331 family)